MNPNKFLVTDALAHPPSTQLPKQHRPNFLILTLAGLRQKYLKRKEKQCMSGK